MENIAEVMDLLYKWEDQDNAGRDVTPILTRLAEIFELETQAFLKLDPDPFDDRHPSRLVPECTLGHILKSVFRNQRLVDTMVKVYCQRDVVELNTAVCRFLLDILPGLESVIFQEESFVLRLFEWAEAAPNPLQTYATGLLAAAMDVPEIASNYRDRNAKFVPLMLKRLYDISKNYLQSPSCDDPGPVSSAYEACSQSLDADIYRSSISEEFKSSLKKPSKLKKDCSKSRYNPIYTDRVKEKSVLKVSPVDESIVNESSNSTWAEYMFGSYQVFPLTLATQQRYILQYLTPMGEYQELIGHVLEENALSLILRYVDLSQNHDVRLAFEALKYLASLLCHKKIAIEFLNVGGLQLLLKVPRPSIAATGVSFCFYYLGYLEEALEKICMLPSSVISDLVKYALWLLECSHDSSRCHATLFIGFGFAYKMILHHFDKQDGLRKLFNVMSTLDIFVLSTTRSMSDDEVFANRLTTRHVCSSLKRYFKAHLAALVEEKRVSRLDVKASMAASMTSEAVERNMEILHECSLTPLNHWRPVNEFVYLDGITFLLELVSTYLALSYSGRAETIKYAIDVLKVCALTAPAIQKFCEKIRNPNISLHVTGISVLLQAAEGQMIPVAEIQRSALLTIINCVCPKVPIVESCARTSTPKRKNTRTIEDLLNKVWKAVRIKNGILGLINLLSIRLPLTDADNLRALACKALCGLARSQNVKQIISKLPLVTDGQLIDLMKEPVLQDKYQDYVQFCKYGFELIERVTGAPLSASECSLNLNKICVSEVVAKTKVVYHEHQLLQLICDHLKQKGFHQSVQCLQQEIKEKSVVSKSPLFPGAFPSSVKETQFSHQPKTFRSSEKSNKSSSSFMSSIPPPSVPLRIVLNKKTQSPDIKSPPCRLQKPQMCSGSYAQSPAFSKMKRQSSATPYKTSQPTISLDSIIKEYLRKQHSLCKNPMLACPPFDLFVPHKCPEPHFKRNAPINSVLRLQKREISFQNGGFRGAALNTKHIYSRFRLHRTLRDEDGRCDFTTSTFFTNNNDPFPKILIGTVTGSVKVFNVNTAKQLMGKDCHFRGISHIESKENTPLFITSDEGRLGNSSLWTLSSTIDLVHNFGEISHMEFGKRSRDKLIGTKHDQAVIFDTATFVQLQAFPVYLGNNYDKNRATFDFADELILTDGLIYDVRSGRILHKLDKFNSYMNGVFHPNGREIISNSEIWDIRTFKLLRTVAGLDQCRVTFNKPGTVIYGATVSNGLMSGIGTSSCFHTFDACNYNTISTVDVKKPVYHLATDWNDRYVATIEGLNGLECMCRVYEVGRTKQLGDENGDESEDSDDDDDDDDDDSEGVELDFDDSEGARFEIQFGDEDNGDVVEDEDDAEEDLTWVSTSESSDDDETLFALNTSSMDD